MAQRKSLLEEIREQNSGANLNQGVVNSARKTVETGLPSQQQESQQQGRRTSLLQEIIDADGMGNLNQDYVNKALGFDGGFGAIAGGYIQGDDGQVYMRDYKSEAEVLRERMEQTAAGNTQKQQEAQEEEDDRTFWQRFKDFFTLKRGKDISEAALTGTGAGYTGAMRVLYEAGQGGRDRENREQLAEWETALDRANRDLEYLLEESGGVENGDVISQRYIIEDLQRKVDAMRKVVGENVQQRATEATSELTHELEQKSQEATERAKAGTGKVGRIAVDAAINMLQMGGDAIAGLATGGNNLVPMAFRVLGQGSSEAQQAGATLGQQLGYGTAAAGIEVFTEKLFDGLAGLYGKGAADELTESIIKKLAKTDAGRTTLRIILGMNEEGLEEVISDLISPLAQTIYNGQSVGESYRNNFDIADTAYSYLIGAIAAGGMNVTRPVATIRSNREANAALREGETQPTAQAQETALPTTQETGTQLVQQTIDSLDLYDEQKQLLMQSYGIGNTDAQDYALGVREAVTLGKQGLTFEQALETSKYADKLSQEQFRQAWAMGAQKGGHNTSTETQTRQRANVPEYDSIESFSREYSAPEKVTAIYDQAPDTDVNEFAQGFQAAYNMGQSGVSANYLTGSTQDGTPYVAGLTAEQAQAAYQMGQEASTAKATQRADTIKGKQQAGNLKRVKSTVRGEGVTIADMKAAFNDKQNRAYRLLTRYAEATGVNIVLYNSQADTATGLYPAAQGRFQWKDDTIYIDINSGLNSINDVDSLGNYTMMRTFAHEFTHFIEKWNPKEYNEFREFVFSTLEQKGENVHDLIESMMQRDESGNMSYEQASREVVADAMMDILPDSTLVQQLANEHPNVFKTLLKKMREFAARMKQYYKGISTNIPEAQMLKQGGAYMESIVDMWDKIAKGAVENYQGANAETETQSKAEAKQEKPQAKAQTQEAEQKQTEETAKQSEAKAEPETKRAGMDFFKPVEVTEEEAPDLKSMVQKAQPETRRVGMEFFKPVEVEEEEAPKLSQMAAKRNQPVSRDRFPTNDFTSREEEAPRLLDRVEKKAEQEVAPEVAQEQPEVAPEEPARQESAEAARLRSMLDAKDSVDFDGFRYEIFGMGSTTINVRDGGVSTGMEYRASINRVTGGIVTIAEGRSLYSETFPTRQEAVDALVAVAENNKLLERKGTDESTESEAPDVRGKKGNRRNGAGTVRVSPEQQESGVSGDAAGRQSDTVPPADGRGTGRDGDRTDAERNGRIGSEGTGESGVQRGSESDVTEQPEVAPSEEEQARKAEELHKTVEHDVEEMSTEKAGGNNFVIGESLNLPNGSKARYKANVDAIRLVKQLEQEGRIATKEEQEILSRYVGWGGIPEAFDEKKGDWSKEYAELKELLTDEEYKAARASTNNAHYTSIEVIRAMYEGLRKLGFNGGRMLEPSSGVGNFVGAMPADMSGKVRSWTMVELDNITGLIAKHLYPQADVRIEGFEKATIPNDFMDVAIGNVPFGNYPIVDRAFPKKVTSAIHNYFFAKSLQKVRPGGIVMFITSSYTMNSKDATVRNYIASQADLLGAIRLPNTAFKQNAGTPVVTDILVLKKRAPGTIYGGEAFVEVGGDQWSSLGYRSEYFINHPEMIMGTEATTGSMYRRNEYTVNPNTEAGTLGEQITKAFENITGQMDYPAKETPEKTNYKVQRAEKGTKQGSFVNKEGKLYQNDGGELKEVQTDAKTAKRISGMLGIRDAMRELMNAQQQGVDEKSIKALRKTLNKLYDDFVKENGYLNSAANKKAFADDPDKFSLFALETDYSLTGTGKNRKETAKKADIFTQNTIEPNRTVTHADTVKDGLTVSRNTTGGVDVELIARLTGKSTEEVTRELIDSELVFKNREGNLEPAETYLSGNVRAKLRDAQGMVSLDKDYQHNVDALKRIVPEDIPHEQIFTQPGTPWIPESVYSDFAAYILGYNGVAIHRSRQTGIFTIDFTDKWSESRIKKNYRNTQEWGTPKRSFLNLLEAVMNSRSVTVTYKDAEGHTIVDQVATAAANEKIEQITKKFQEWLWQDAERTKDLEFLYNETFNNLVNPHYDGSTLTVNGLHAGWSLKPHQADAVQRIISSGGNTLLAHRVGAGKTMEMAAAAMKLKELGIINKPMFAVPKSLVAQWGKEFTDYFPAAKLLVADENSMNAANRKTFANRIATGNYDAIIVSYEQFEKIPISDGFAASLYQQQIDEIIQAINEAKVESGKNSMSVKNMEKKRKQLEAKLQKLTSKPKDTDSIEFEQLGVDSIFVDEAHNFKNLFYTTAMQNVAGLGNKDGSQRAFDLYTKTRYLQQLNGGRGIVFATATPVMNSMSEMYIMQKYLQPDLLDQLGLSTFDAWAKQFGEVVNGVEIKPSGQGYRIKQSFSRFKNMNELQLLFRNFSDVLTQIPDLKIPRMKGGAVKIVECEAGEFQQAYMEELTQRADNIKNVDPRKDNMLKITSDGRKISYTQRMIDPSLPYEEGCKIYRCADNVFEEYQQSKDIRGTQIVFCDMATPKGKSNNAKAQQEEETIDTESAQLYADLKARLVKLGIPAKEISFIHDADTQAKKDKLFADVNDGKVRVLIGSTGKMGVGMNAQKRVVAIHHLDAPWRPGDVEQRDGRAFRQKNINEEVSKYVYVTKGSFDARLWDIIDRKSSFINAIMNGENVGRDVEDTGEVTLSAAEVKALASGSPLILEQVQLESDIKKLENLYMAHQRSKAEASRKLQEAKQQKAEAESRAANAKKDIKHRTEASTDEKFSITVGSTTYTDKKKAGKALMDAIIAKSNEDSYTKIGTFAGFDVLAMHTKEGYIGLLKADGAYRFNVYPDNTTLIITNAQKVLNSLDSTVTMQEELARQKTQEIEAQEKLSKSEFDKQEELDQKRRRYNEVMEILNPKEEQAMTSDVDEEDNVEYSLRVRQEFSSAATSLNQVAALFKNKNFIPEDINIDIGGGAFNATTEYLAEHYGTTNMVYDPYNRGADENLATLDFLRAGNRADTATCANVLNVIKEQEARRNVILEVAKSIKEDGTAYFSVYEKDKSGQGRQTGADQWQNSRATADYVHEIEEFFDDVERKGAIIIAKNPKANLPAAFWRITEQEEIEYATRRTNGLSNREILSMAAEEINVEGLSEAEQNALQIFRDNLSRLREEQENRAELGRQYKEQQFTKGGSRQEADRIRVAMSVADSKIKSLENRLLSLENKDILKQVLEKARRVVEQEERKRGDENLKRYRERRNESAAARKYRERVRTEVETLRKWLVNPSNKDMRKHVPAEIQKTVADFLESINLMSKTALRTSGLETTKADERYLKNMKKMRDAIKANVNSQGLYSGYNDLPADFIENFDALISKTQQHISDNSGVFVVNAMNANELHELANTLKTLKKYITTMNSFHNNAMFAHAYDAGEETVEHLSKFEKSKKSGFVYKFLRFDYMRPSYAFEHFGKGGQSIEHEFREGQATQAFLANKIIDFAKKTYTAKEVKKWSEEIKTFTTTDGEKVSMPVTHLMSLYCLNKRPQALTHIYGDGIRVANYKDGKRVQLDEGHIVTISDVQEMIQELTPRQREVADALQKYMSTETATWGNYVSMARFDVEQFTEENYFPINSDGRYLSTTADESPDNAGLYALLNSSFTKELKENADNRIILYNIFDVFANHTASMTQYRSFALPVLDALKWFNYKNDTTSVRTKLSSAFGAPLDERAGSGAKGYAEQFVIDLLKAYNGTAAQGDPYDTLPLKMLHRFNGAAIAYNLRVVIQQPTAITRAAMVLSPTKLAKGLGMSVAQMRKLADEMEAHSGIAAWKALGFYDTNISRGLTDLIKQNPSALDRAMEVGTKGAEMADRFTWAAMWYAAKDTVKRSDYTTEEEYFKAVTDLFEEVIYKTQVVDSLLTKAQFLRSKGGIARQMGSFMSEPSATMSMLADAYFKYTDDMQQGMSRSEAWKRNGGNIVKTAMVYAVGQVILSAMQAVIDAWRDQDDEDPENWLNNYIQKYINAFKGNVIEEELIFGKIPLVSELYELSKGYLDKFGVFDKLGVDLYGNDISTGLVMYTKYLTKAIEIIAGKQNGDSKYNNYTPYSIAYNLIRAVSSLSGIPFATALREVQDIWNNTVGYFAPDKKLVSYQKKVNQTYATYIKDTGLSQKDYQAILDKADQVYGDSSGTYKMDEVGAALVAALEEGSITEAQADAIWRSKWHKENNKTFSDWRSGGKKSSGSGSAEPAAAKTIAVPFTPSTPAPAAKTATVTGFDDFKKAAPIYGSAEKQAMYSVWESSLQHSGMTLDRFTQMLQSADTDGNDSIKQDEMGVVLMQAMQSGELTFDQCDAIWRAQWNKARSKTFAKWLNG